MYRSLQGCRAIAAALVVLFHMGGTFAQDRYFGFKALDGPFAWGDAGVDFFFVLSGFLITLVHRRDFGQPQKVFRYIAKRTVRIYPTYWLICLAVCLSAVAFPVLRQALPSDAMTYLAALTLLPLDPASVGGTGSPILFVAWSLQYELLFYAIVAVFIVHRAAGFLVVAALLLAKVGCHVGNGCTFPQSFVASNMVLLFAMGVLAAYVAGSRLRVPAPRLLAAAAATAFVAFGALEVWVGREAIVVDRRLVFGALSCLVIIGLVRAEDERSLVVEHRWLDLLGDSSYALYLIHIPIISLLVKLVLRFGPTSNTGLVGSFIGIFAICLASAILFHQRIERPMLAWLGARLDRWVKRSPRALGRPAAPLVAQTREGIR